MLDIVRFEGFESVADGRQFYLPGQSAENRLLSPMPDSPVPTLDQVRSAMARKDFNFETIQAVSDAALPFNTLPCEDFTGEAFNLWHSTFWMVDLLGCKNHKLDNAYVDIYPKFDGDNGRDYHNRYYLLADPNRVGRINKIFEIYKSNALRFLVFDPTGVREDSRQTLNL